ncbi:MAG: ABC transporter ATP-binding protein [Cycloclasticus sp.]
MNTLNIDIKSKAFTTADKHTVTVIEDLQFKLSNNEFVCIIGPSGCGKTSLLNIIAGLDKRFSGSVSLSEAGTQFKTSYIFQNPRLLPWRTVLENIQLASNEQANNDTKIIQLLQRLGLADSLNSYPHHLSLGMQRRVALARGFYRESDILLMDEPLVSLDPPTARKARTLLIELWQQQARNVLFVTHDLDEAIELADRLIFISSSPSHVVADIKVDIARGERSAKNIEQFKLQLSSQRTDIAHLM